LTGLAYKRGALLHRWVAMAKISDSDRVCPVCQAPLSGNGTCLACLLRAGLTETAVVALPAITVYGDFEIARREDGSLWELGRGAMGVTYRAVDRVLHRSVALKVIRPGLASDSQAVRERFLREARAAAALKHPNVAGVFQFGFAAETGPCYYAMELVEGETLEGRIRRDGPLDVHLTLEIAAQVTGALAAAAQRGLIHRDLKPGNLMLSSGQPGSSRVEVKVIDFGLAKAVAIPSGINDLTQGGFIGTPAFASPEQFDGGNLDARSDIYSLGVTLWFALTGQTPFAGPTLAALRDSQARSLLPVDQLAARKVPPRVIDLLRSMLAEDRMQRPASARELAGTLETFRRDLEGGRRGRQALARGRPTPRTLVLAAGVLASTVLLAAGAWWAAAHPPAPSDKSIAVLPFANLSADKDNAFFTEGVQGEILTDLAQVADLKVISRTSVMQYKAGFTNSVRDIAAQLGVAHIVEGSVQRSGNEIRVTAQLIDARTDANQWADRYDRPLDNVFAIQSEIAQAIVGQLKAKLSPGEKAAIDTPPTSNLAAYDAYLQGKKLLLDVELTKEEAQIRQAARQLEEATSRDPQFFLAWYELCRAHLNLYWFNFDHTQERLARAESAAQTARQLRPQAGETHLLEGVLLYMGHRDFAGAISEFQAAVRLLPNNSEAPFWRGRILRRQGQWAESIHELQRAAELDPRNPELKITLAETEEFTYRFAAAGRATDEAIQLDPHNLNYAFWKAYCARRERADLEPIRRWLRSVPADSESSSDAAALVATDLALDEGDYPKAAQALANYRPPTISDADFILPRAELEGTIAALNGDQEAATTALTAARLSAAQTAGERPQDAKALLVLARIDSELGRREQAIREGEQACAMLPVSADAIDGPYLQRELAGIYATVGDPARALDTLQSIVGKPAGPSYGDLRLEHHWDSLRGNSRFDALIASLAPKTGQ
jgi:TolB-like protein/Tfp pilus assembly protein PilF